MVRAAQPRGGKIEVGVQKQHTTPLTEANLSEQNKRMDLHSWRRSSIERWLSELDDTVIHTTVTKDWEELCRQDKVAAEIERIVQAGAQNGK